MHFKMNLIISNEINLADLQMVEMAILKAINSHTMKSTIEDLIYNIGEKINGINIVCLNKRIDFLLRNGTSFYFDDIVKLAASLIMENSQFVTYFNSILTEEQKVIFFRKIVPYSETFYRLETLRLILFHLKE